MQKGESMSDAPKGLVSAINDVMRAVTYLQKTGHNKFHGYKYASEADMKAAFQPAMAEAGLVLLPVGIEYTTVEAPKTAKGKEQFRTDMRVKFKLAHVSGEHELVEVVGCGIDSEDKGIYKAMTGAIKYALHTLFLTPTGEDAEQDSADVSSHSPTSAPVYQANGDPAAFRIVLGAHKGKTLAELTDAELSALLDGMHNAPDKMRTGVHFLNQLKHAETEMMERTRPAVDAEVQP